MAFANPSKTAPDPEFAARLLAWYDRHARSLPWRVSPSDRLNGMVADPYRVWLSEIMLQQTTVQAVKPYFASFARRWPSVNDLAAADTEDVMKAWAGLGYYSRARNLKRCADVVAADHGGRFPDTEEGLRALPGIGPYTAAAIAAIAFDRRAAVVDGNIERVFTRLFEIDTPLPSAKNEIRAAVHEVTPAERPGDFAQALMDLGATICTPKRPACVLCPLNEGCLARLSGRQEQFPVKPMKKEKPVRLGAAFVAERSDGAVLLVKRPETGLLGGMTGVPSTNWTVRADGATGARSAPFEADWRSKGVITHVFTHFELRLEIFHAVVTGAPDHEGWWSDSDSLPGEALPTVMKKALRAAFPALFRKGPA
ncbi:MAG: A/G-specific adenine glycosylase [Hoeflea sp.]|uniref:A/G-specific adenine glycosylase n=1 Tax=Hoeflea sp. TaxID=1940281 RepID=UPI001D219D5B|nr:A/G-specific adenine glycosylase [Hoeflea sp.]MBU4527760.1 A/G-specific adenine glycosylase [Alphaproteobacteria bacterium]MBU4546205.1 A/G-specific adenine glycosylase [Alphaproteobacteria bacterium]MBU4553110.1 A/G-specific adenine glycosylase [Alphaproteobacteria bacterium]MBV1724182.1 A/G-specific adenine glycosylase [Hoeflea sp.]MBV1759867.1 A/G-specific adenine glycosylase [Hoeflea sp.]